MNKDTSKIIVEKKKPRKSNTLFSLTRISQRVFPAVLSVSPHNFVFFRSLQFVPLDEQLIDERFHLGVLYQLIIILFVLNLISASFFCLFNNKNSANLKCSKFRRETHTTYFASIEITRVQFHQSHNRQQIRCQSLKNALQISVTLDEFGHLKNEPRLQKFYFILERVFISGKWSLRYLWHDHRESAQSHQAQTEQSCLWFLIGPLTGQRRHFFNDIVIMIPIGIHTFYERTFSSLTLAQMTNFNLSTLPFCSLQQRRVEASNTCCIMQIPHMCTMFRTATCFRAQSCVTRSYYRDQRN